jgi:hypothetical protein
MNRRRPYFLGLCPMLVLFTSAAAPAEFEPTDRYEVKQVEGWTVLVNKGFLADEPGLSEKTLKWLGNQLSQIEHKLPAKAVGKLKEVKIWVEKDEPHHPCMAYHPDKGWLQGHGMNPEKARCVEIANAGNFLKWTREQPWMVLHELAHAYHHQFLDDGFNNSEVKAAYRNAIEEKSYASVLHYNGKSEKAYATTNPMEYFAEATEAFFGANDFFPFVRAELKQHDPEMETLLKTLWGAR